MAQTPGTECPATSRPWVLLATILGSTMVFIDGSAVNVALPVLQVDLGATVTDVQWVIETYTLLLAALILPGGALGDRFGRRRVFLSGVALFALSSLWCGLSPSVRQLVAARALQGVGGALLVPGSLALITASFLEEDRGGALGTWSGATAITSAAGPVLGGWMATSLSWRWVFFLNLPLALVVVVVALRHLPEARDGSMRGGIDWGGAAASVAGLGLITYALIRASIAGFTGPVALALLGGMLALAGFVLIERRAANPMLPPSLFASRSFTGANLLTLLLYGALGGALFFVPFALIQVHGYSATQAGAAWLPTILLIAGLSRWTGGLVPIVGARTLLAAGPLITAAGFLLFARPAAAGPYWTTFFPGFVSMGLGMAATVAPLVTVVMGAVSDERAGAASGVNNAISRVAGLLAIAGLGLVVLVSFSRHLEDRLASAALPPAIVADVMARRADLAALRPPAQASPEQAALVERSVDRAFVSAFRLAMVVAAGLAAASALVGWLTIEAPDRERPSG